MPLPPVCVSVVVEGSIEEDALVPVPVHGEIEMILWSVESHLAWPLDMIIFLSTMTKMVCRREYFLKLYKKRVLYVLIIFFTYFRKR